MQESEVPVRAPGALAPDRASVESTYKARDVEGFLDLHFYRPVGFWVARFCARLGLTPSMVSLLGAALGILAGHLYYYRELSVNLLGMALHVVTNAFDNADGQLARLTHRGSLAGAVMDGFADYLVFFSIYLHLVLRYMAEGGSAAIWFLAAAAGASHALQCMVTDYYRDAYLGFVEGKPRAGLDSSQGVRAASQRVSWRTPGKKIALQTYLSYTRQQEFFAPNLRRLRSALRGVAPAGLIEDYRSLCRPLIKWGNLLAANTRMLILFTFLLLGQPVWYFVVVVTGLNLVLFCVMARQDTASRSLLARLGERL